MLKRLVGYAGTGKTYTISRCIQALPLTTPLRILLCSPTNKALKVLKSNFEGSADNNPLIEYQFLTIAQTLGKQPVENNQKMEEEFLIVSPKELDQYQVIIVDEYSMIGQEDLEDLLIKYSGKILFVGDNAQLSPINQKSPPVDDLEEFIDDDNTWRLTEVMRYSGQVGLLAYELRNTSPRKINRTNFSGDETLVWLQGRDEVKKLLKEASNRFSEDPNNFRILTYTNKSCVRYNEQFRLHLWGLHADDSPYHVGERLIAKSPVSRGSLDGSGATVRILNNSDEFTLTESATLKEATASEILPEYQELLAPLDKYKWRYWVLPYGFYNLRVLDEEMAGEYKKLLKRLADSRDGKLTFWKMKSQLFDDIGYAYALTTHKAQGSTFDSVLILWDELQARYLDDADSRRLTYTAITRCKSCAYCLV
ncbi:ATP-dependent DNA helicase [Roseofilum sp. Belize Diploria]|uniref:ATP-dependent DNA helicase n=1 Tax=Roseofilum sp. Belize Diploria TaxID=2821501 RepID=UPI00298EBB6F|nr:AAA family ATPase [Roseofilum sp. Belize Diploria]